MITLNNNTNSSEETLDSLEWYCVRSQPRSENLASLNLLKLNSVDVFFPRTIRIQKLGNKKRKVLEPLFPSYIFARFNPAENMRAVNYCHGVTNIVKRGEDIAPIDPKIISDLMAFTEDGLLELPDKPFAIGEEVKIISGIFKDGIATIDGLLPAQERVRVLLEFLGRSTLIDISEEDLERTALNPLSKSP